MNKALTYKEAVEEIENILNKINSNDLDVDNLSEMVSKANELLEVCKTKLLKAQKEVEKINEKSK